MILPDPHFDDGQVTLYRGDCRDVLPLIVGRHGVVAHVLTDPPYGARVKRGARSLSKKRGGKGPSRGRDDHALGELGGALVPFSADVRLVYDALAAAAPARWSMVFCDFQHAAALERQPFEGARHVRTGVWVKPDSAPQFTGDRPGQGWEAISLLHAIGRRLAWNAGGRRGVWTHGIERDVPWHPTPKPVGLLRELLRDFTSPGDLVVDPFGGSAATAVACRFEGRRCVAIELDESFADLGAQRLREGRGRLTDRSMPTTRGRQVDLFGGSQ